MISRKENIIAIDGSPIHSDFTGVGRYLSALLTHLAPLDRNIKYRLILREGADIDIESDNFQKVHLKAGGSTFLWQNRTMRQYLKQEAHNLFWSPNYAFPFSINSPRKVLTVHDISWRARPDNYSLRERLFKEKTIGRSIRSADHIFTVSDFSKSEIHKYYGLDMAGITPVHHGIDASFKRSSPVHIDNFRKRYAPGGGPILGFLGSIFKRRHLRELVAAFGRLKARYPGIRLLLFGNNYDRDILPDQLHQPGIVWKKRLPEGQINDFYSSLDLFIYLSDYEGFGMPPMEALNCGTVPLLLNRTSLAEVYENMALFVNETSVDTIVSAVNKYLGQKQSLESAILNRYNQEKSRYSWTRAAEAYLIEFQKQLKYC